LCHDTASLLDKRHYINVSAGNASITFAGRNQVNLVVQLALVPSESQTGYCCSLLEHHVMLIPSAPEGRGADGVDAMA
jgi:hypothetical protein